MNLSDLRKKQTAMCNAIADLETQVVNLPDHNPKKTELAGKISELRVLFIEESLKELGIETEKETEEDGELA